MKCVLYETVGQNVNWLARPYITSKLLFLIFGYSVVFEVDGMNSGPYTSMSIIMMVLHDTKYFTIDGDL